MDSELIRQRARAFDYLFDAVVIVDLNGFITDWNTGSEKLYGYSKEEVIGKPVSMLRVPEDIEKKFIEVMASVEKTGKWTGEVKMLHKDGHIGWIESMCVPYRDSNNNVIGSLGVNRDISKRIANEIKLKKQQAELQNEVKVKNRFFSIIAHDLNGPFALLLGLTNILSKKADKLTKEKIVDMTKVINDAALQAFSLQKNLLQWSRLQFSAGQVISKSILLPKLVEDTMDVYKMIAADKKISLVSEISEVKVFGDCDMIHTILRNLISNALKFSHEGGVVTLSSKTVDDMVQISVVDEGVGISKEEIDNLFVLDHLTSVKGTSGETGTGIGMSLCREMVQENGGCISAESILGEGTRVTFSLPVSLP